MNFEATVTLFHFPPTSLSVSLRVSPCLSVSIARKTDRQTGRLTDRQRCGGVWHVCVLTALTVAADGGPNRENTGISDEGECEF